MNLQHFYFSSKVEAEATDTKDETEPNVSLVEELQTKLHELEVRDFLLQALRDNTLLFSGNDIFRWENNFHF